MRRDMFIPVFREVADGSISSRLSLGPTVFREIICIFSYRKQFSVSSLVTNILARAGGVVDSVNIF